MHRRPHFRGATWDISSGFQSKLALGMQLTGERSLELLVIAVTRLSGGKVFVTRINSYYTVMPESRLKKKWKYGKTAMRILPGSDGTVA